MKTILKPSGDNYILEIDKSILEKLNINPDKPVEVVLYPSDSDDDAVIEDALKDLDERYAETMKRLSQ